jgi:hypothetical protein
MFTDMRIVIAAVIVVGLALGVFLLWPDGEPDDPPDTLATPSTTTPTSETPSTTDAGTTTSVDGTQVVETVEEAEAILRELWFGWFEGIYNEDEDRIREVVATTAFLNAGVNAFAQLEFSSVPTADGLAFDELEILESSPDCLAVWSVTTPSFMSVAEPRSGVEVLRFADDGWKFASSWRFKEDLWEADCEAELLPLP